MKMNQKQNIKSFFEKNCPLNTEGIEELLGAFKRKAYSKHSMLLQEGQQEYKVRFLNEGSLREFYLNDSKESNINFYIKPMFISDISSFINQIPTRKNQETVSAVEMFELTNEKFYQLLEKYSCGIPTTAKSNVYRKSNMSPYSTSSFWLSVLRKRNVTR